MSSKTKLPLYGAMVVVIVLVLFFAFTNNQPADEEASGAIGAAEKYRTEQITEDDVQLNNAEWQNLLQNDDILRLLENEEFRRIVASDDFGRLMAKQDVLLDFRKMLRSPEYSDFRRSDFNLKKGNRLAFFSQDFAMTLRDRNFRADVITGDFSKLMRRQIFEEGPFTNDFANMLEESKVCIDIMKQDDFAKTLKLATFQKAITANDHAFLKTNATFARLFEETDFANLMASRDNRDMLTNTIFYNALFDIDQREYILNPSFHRLMAERQADVISPDFLNGLNDPSVQKFMQLGEFSDFMMKPSAREFFLDNDLANFLAAPDAREFILNNTAFYRSLADPDFSNMLMEPHKRAVIGSNMFSRMLAKWQTESSIK